MGTSKSGADLSKKLVRYAGGVPAANRRAVGAAAMQFKNAVLDAADRDLARHSSPPRHFSRWGKAVGEGKRKGLKVGAGYDVKGSANAVALLKARPQGPWKVLEYGAKSHPLVPGATMKMRREAAFVAAFTGAEVGPSALYSRRAGLGNRARKVLRVPGSPSGFAMYASHPGSKAKRTWSQAIIKRSPKATQVIRNVHAKHLARSFK
jgi:hypothetical protein